MSRSRGEIGPLRGFTWFIGGIIDRLRKTAMKIRLNQIKNGKHEK